MKHLDQELGERPERSTKQAGLRRERWVVLGVVGVLLGAVAVPQTFVRRGKNAPAQKPPPPQPTEAWEFRGVSLQLHAYDAGVPFEKYLDEIAKTGANAVSFSLAAYQENCASSSLFIEMRKSPSPRRLEGLIRRAHGHGMKVLLMPIILLENPGTGEWRGKIKPQQPEAWWEDYENYILFYAKIAERTGTEVLVIGSELVSLTDEVDHWRGLIRKVRKVYSGRITYSSNWDHYFNVIWWRDLDMIGMTSYYDLVGEDKPTLEVLRNAWKPIKKDILALQRKFDRPILFTEVGWPSQVGCAKQPWNYYGSTTPDPAAQATCFKAFFDTWAGEKAVAGVLVWEWRNHEGVTGGPKDTSYFPGGKPAMEVIRERFLSRGRPAGDNPTTTRQQTPP